MSERSDISIEAGRSKSFRDWLMVVLIAIAVLAAFLASAYVINEQNQSTEILLQRFEENAHERLEQAITVNVLTISCLLIIQPEDRTDAVLRQCIEDGFEGSELEPPLPGS